MSEMDYDSADEEVWDNSDDDVEMTQEDEGSSASEEEYMDDYNDDFKVVSSKGKRKSYEIEAEALPVEAIEETINKDVEHVVGIFGIDTSTALILLRHMNWNKERLIEKYMDNPNALDTAAGISLPPPLPTAASASRSSGIRRITRRSASLASPTSKVSEPFTCPVCYDTSPPSTSSLQCGHQFCDDCWGMYLHAKIRDEGECTIGCMASDCSIVAPDTFIERACDKETFTRFKELIARHFVAHTSHLKFCPYPSCTYTISCPSAATRSSLLSMVPTVHCTEGHTFCFGCNHEGDHRPLICAVVKLWLKKCQDDSETANWIKSNTKECSKCQSTIEKNGGCNHMTCKKCKYEFCWVCMGPWSEHGTQWYNCNRFEEQSGVEARDQQSKSRASLERYLHYYNRWANHEQSIRLSKDLYAKTEKKMEEMQITSNLTWIEVQFARKAVDEVERCRTTLKWTYAMAYYLEKSNEKELFEDNQRDLEKAVEDLSELLESPIEPDHIATLRQKMTDKTVYVQKRNEIMLEDTANGFQEGRWEWNVSIE